MFPVIVMFHVLAFCYVLIALITFIDSARSVQDKKILILEYILLCC